MAGSSRQPVGSEEPEHVLTVGSLLIPNPGSCKGRVIYALNHLHYIATITQRRGRNGRIRGSAGVSPAVAGASRSRRRKVFLYTRKHRSIEGQEEAQEGAGKMPVPQRARRPRYELLATVDRRCQSLQRLCGAPIEQALTGGNRVLY